MLRDVSRRCWLKWFEASLSSWCIWRFFRLLSLILNEHLFVYGILSLNDFYLFTEDGDNIELIFGAEIFRLNFFFAHTVVDNLPWAHFLAPFWLAGRHFFKLLALIRSVIDDKRCRFFIHQPNWLLFRSVFRGRWRHIYSCNSMAWNLSIYGDEIRPRTVKSHSFFLNVHHSAKSRWIRSWVCKPMKIFETVRVHLFRIASLSIWSLGDTLQFMRFQ